MKTLTIPVQVEPSIKVIKEFDILYRDISDLLVSAFEGGSNYWIDSVEEIKPKELHYKYDPNHIYPYYTYPLNEGGAILIYVDDETNKPYHLTLDTIEQGINLMAKHYLTHFYEWINENYDATTGDIFLQLCLFGEVIYG